MEKEKGKSKRKKRKHASAGTTSEPVESEDPAESVNRKKKKARYSSHKWHTSSSESEYEAVSHPKQVAVRNLPQNLTDDDLKNQLADFFDVERDRVRLFNVEKDTGVYVTQCVVAFASETEAKEALKLRGNRLGGKALYIKPNGNSRDIVRVSGFSTQLTIEDTEEQLRRSFSTRGEVLRVFVPKNGATGGCLGFGYVYIDLEGLDSNTAQKDLLKLVQIGGASCNVVKAKPKSCFETDMVGKIIPIEPGSEKDKKTSLKRVLLPLDTNLQTSPQTPFSWTKKTPDIIDEPYEQKTHDCWAIALKRGYAAKKRVSGESGDSLTVDALLKGVDAGHQASEEGIDRVRNACSFMKNYVKEMKVHRRPRGDKPSDHEGFERYIKKLLAVSPVTVTVEYLPGFEAFCSGTDGKGVYRPTEMDCHLRNFEKFPIHCLLLTGYDVIDGVECWELQDSQGTNWGTNGFIMMEQHKCLIKSVVEFML